MTSHSETRTLPYIPEQMFALVADVARYPEFLPWTAAARIRSRRPVPEGELMEADLVISFKVFREKFGSRVLLQSDENRITTEYLDGPFKHLRAVWDFAPDPVGCRVEFNVDFEFRNIILQKAIGVVFNEAMQRIVRSFEERAAALYGA